MLLTRATHMDIIVPNMMSILLTVTVILLLSPVESSMVHEQRPLTVRRGRSAHLYPLDLLLTVPEDATCRIEVDQFDVTSQRVGRIEPKVSSFLL